MAEQIYNANIHPQLLLKLAEKGLPYHAFIAETKIAVSTWYQWIDLHPEFKSAYDSVDHIAYMYWLNLAMRHAENSAYDLSIVKLMLTTRFRKFTQGVKLAKFKDLKTALEQHQMLLRAATNEEITPLDAKALVYIVEAGVRLKDIREQNERLAALEAK